MLISSDARLPTRYDAGAASVTAGSKTVTPHNARWAGNAWADDLFCLPSQPLVPPIRIGSVNPDGTLTLSVNWPGASATEVAYELRYVGMTERSTRQSRKVLEQLNVVEANGRGMFYIFDGSSSNTDPGTGRLRLNAVDPAAATSAYIDNLDANGAVVSAIIDTWDDGGASDRRGQLWLRSIGTPSSFRAYDLTGVILDASGYRKVTLLHIGGSGSFVDGEEVMVMMSPAGVAGQNGQNGSNGADGNINLIAQAIACGRLTLQSGVAVSTVSQLAKTSLYWTPYQGNLIGLYVGGQWVVRAFVETALSLAGIAAGKLYDVFAYDNAGTLALEALAWTNDTTRATALVKQNGVEVKSGDPTRRYLGTFYTSAAGQTQINFGSAASGGGAAFIGLWNRYNRVAAAINVTDSDSQHSYQSATVRAWAGGATCRVSMVRGLDVDAIAVRMVALFTTAADGYANVGLGLDNANFVTARLQNYVVGGRIASTGTAVFDGLPGLGLHFVQGLEQGDGSTTTVFQGTADYHRLSATIPY